MVPSQVLIVEDEVLDDEGDYEEVASEEEFEEVDVEVDPQDEVEEKGSVETLVETYMAWGDEDLAEAIHDKLDTQYAKRDDIHEDTMCVMNAPRSSSKRTETMKRSRGTKSRGGDIHKAIVWLT